MNEQIADQQAMMKAMSEKRKGFYAEPNPMQTAERHRDQHIENKNRPIAVALSQLESNIDGLAGVLSELEIRLYPVTRTEPVKDDDRKLPGYIGSETTIKLWAHAQTIGQLSDSVEDILKRLEV